jgi:hypothetical protein
MSETNKTRKYNCEKCNYRTNITAKWKRHLETTLHQTGERKVRSDCKDPIKCEQCEYKTKNKTNMKHHYLNEHGTMEERKTQFKFYCEGCDYGTFSIDLFNVHKTTNKHNLIKKLI